MVWCSVVGGMLQVCALPGARIVHTSLKGFGQRLGASQPGADGFVVAAITYQFAVVVKDQPDHAEGYVVCVSRGVVEWERHSKRQQQW